MAKIDDLLSAPGIESDLTGAGLEKFTQVTNYALNVATALGEEDFTKAEAVLPKRSGIGMAVAATMQTVTALLSAASVKCHLSTPAADIDMKLNSSGQLIYRCYHNPPHEWYLDGKPFP
jgi:hypothetical protein